MWTLLSRSGSSTVLYASSSSTLPRVIPKSTIRSPTSLLSLSGCGDGSARRCLNVPAGGKEALRTEEQRQAPQRAREVVESVAEGKSREAVVSAEAIPKAGKGSQQSKKQQQSPKRTLETMDLTGMRSTARKEFQPTMDLTKLKSSASSSSVSSRPPPPPVLDFTKPSPSASNPVHQQQQQQILPVLDLTKDKPSGRREDKGEGNSRIKTGSIRKARGEGRGGVGGGSSRSDSSSTIGTGAEKKKESPRDRMHRLQGQEFKKPVGPITVTLPAGQEQITLKDLAQLTNLGLDRLMWHLVELGGKETQGIIPPRVLEKIRGGRTTSRGAMNAAASTIEIPMDTAELLLLEMGAQVKYASDLTHDRLRSVATLETPKRAPIVVVMGHVDHGKTTLLDALRKTDIAKGEQGGITQSIAGFRIELANGQSACFLDTPGHEAFASMRKSGTAVTDVACVVVAATDGVMPQTIESVKYARAAALPIVFAITKTDMAKDRASTVLTNEDIEAKIIDQLNLSGLYDASSDVFVPVVAPKGQGLDELMEAILLQIDINESRFLARCVATAPGEAVVLESKVDRGFGPVADVVVRWGTLKVGDFVVCDEQWGKIRRMINYSGNPVQTCPPATPVRLCGFESLLSPGSDVLVVPEGERECKRIIEYRQKKRLKIAERDAKHRLIQEEAKKRQENMDKIKKLRATRREKKEMRKMQQDKLEQDQAAQEERRSKEFRVMLKADAEGSLNALLFAAKQMKQKGDIPEGYELVIVKSGVGQLSDQDLELAKTTDSYILGFNIKLPNALAKKAKAMQIPGVSTHPVIYNLLEEFQERYIAKTSGENENEEDAQVVRGTAQVLDIFELKGKEKRQVAGIRVLDGILNKNDLYVVKRNGEVVAQFRPVDSLRVLKKDVAIVEKGAECGLALKDFAGFQKGDVIEAIDPATVSL